MTQKVSTCLMFDGTAEQALKLYSMVFESARSDHVEHYGSGEPGPEGGIKRAELEMHGQRFICFDTPVQHAFSFTPSISLFIECDSETEIERVFGQLADGGETLMPLDNYGFSRRFGWLNDRFGVSWQLNLE